MALARGLITVGADIGQKQDPTAIAVAQTEMRPLIPYATNTVEYDAAMTIALTEGPLYAGPTEAHHVIRMLRRLPLGRSYPEVTGDIVTVCQGAVNQGRGQIPRLYVDATGVGAPVVDMLRAARVQGHLMPVYFTHGDRRVLRKEGPTPRLVSPHLRQQRDTRPLVTSLGKAWLVSRLQALLQTGRLHLPRTQEAQAMEDELRNYEIKIDADANEKYGAFKTGKHDDLVTAVGLATLDDTGIDAPREEQKREPVVPGVL